MSFRSQYFPRNSRSTILDQYPAPVVQFLKDTSLVDCLQTIVDLSQQRGFCTKQRLDSFVDAENHLTVSQREYNEAKERCDYLFRCYHSYVDLFRLCTGSWRPRRPVRNNDRRGNQRTDEMGAQEPMMSERPMTDRSFQQRRPDRQNGPAKPWRQPEGQKYQTPTQQRQQRQPQERRSYQPGSYPTNSGNQDRNFGNREGNFGNREGNFGNRDGNRQGSRQNFSNNQGRSGGGSYRQRQTQ
jgi:hypothetical protein